MRGKAGKYGVGDLARVGWDVIYCLERCGRQFGCLCGVIRITGRGGLVEKQNRGA